MAKQNFGGVYANMDFPPYVWQEYPKYIATGVNGQHTIVYSAVEESALKNKMQKAQDDMPAEPVHYVADPEKEILISRAAELEVPINRKWSKAKLEQVVKEAEEAIDDLPAEEAPVKNMKLAVIEEYNDDQEIVEDSESPEEYKDRLINEAKALNIPANKLWGIPRLTASIAEAKAKMKV